MPDSTGKDIGQLKLEHVINRAVFLAPKAYYLDLGITEKPIIKIKGLNKEAVNMAMETELTFFKFYNLLYKDSTQNIKQTKWFKNLSQGSIEILEQSYEIKHNHNKRKLVFINNILVSTKPYILPIVLTIKQDNFIRCGYYGGVTDYYKAYGENLYYYDVNSLYPFAMLNNMPLNIIKTYNHVHAKLRI